MNPSWSPVVPSQEDSAVPSMSLDPDSTYPYYYSDGRFVKHDEIIAPDLLSAIKQNHYMIRQIKQSWWMAVESEEESFAQPQDTFLCRRDHIAHDILVKNPTEEERPTLTYKKLFMKNEMAYFRTIWITIEYGSIYEGNQHWIRQTVAYLKDGVSPCPFQKDCRPEHHKHAISPFPFSS